MPRYLVITLRTPDFDPLVVPAHYVFLDRLKSEGRLELSGPFTDKSGGAYLLTASHLDEARQIAFDDPVHTSGSSEVTVREWNAR